MKTLTCCRPSRKERHFALAVLLLFYAGCISAQPVESTDLTSLVHGLVETVATAHANQIAAGSNAVNLDAAAEIFERQRRNIKLPDRNRAAAQSTALDLNIRGWNVRLDAARQNYTLLVSASETVREIQSRTKLATEANEKHFTSDSQREIDTEMTNLEFEGSAAIDACSAQALRSARDFYQGVCRDELQPRNWNEALDSVAHELSDWAAQNRKTIIVIDAKLRELGLKEANAVALAGQLDSQPNNAQTATPVGNSTASAPTAAIPRYSLAVAPAAFYPAILPPAPPIVYTGWQSVGAYVLICPPRAAYSVGPQIGSLRCWPHPPYGAVRPLRSRFHR